jgi:hypothetical protein
MSFSSLTTQELQKTIAEFMDRLDNLKATISNIRTEEEKVTLRRHLDNYESTLIALRNELQNRSDTTA